MVTYYCSNAVHSRRWPWIYCYRIATTTTSSALQVTEFLVNKEDDKAAACEKKKSRPIQEPLQRGIEWMNGDCVRVRLDGGAQQQPHEKEEEDGKVEQ